MCGQLMAFVRLALSAALTAVWETGPRRGAGAILTPNNRLQAQPGPPAPRVSMPCAQAVTSAPHGADGARRRRQAAQPYAAAHPAWPGGAVEPRTTSSGVR